MDNKTERLWTRVTPEFKRRLDRIVATGPADRAQHIRYALEIYVRMQEAQIEGRRAYAETLPECHQ